jgi:filamentous hemagglutinin
MKIPNDDAAFVPPEKLTGYLLALTHPVGGPKARFFQAHGFDETNTAELEAGLLSIARGADAEAAESPHGVKYVADDDLLTPSGRSVRVRTVWIVEPTDPRPRLITAYPA